MKCISLVMVCLGVVMGIIAASAVMIIYPANARAEREFTALNMSDLTFSATNNEIYFYEPNGRRIFVYSSNGDFRRAFILKSLGQELETISRYQLREMTE